MKQNRYFFITIVGIHKLTDGVNFLNMSVATKEGRYINEYGIIKAVIANSQLSKPAILNVIELSEEDYLDLSSKEIQKKDMKKNLKLIK